MREHLSSPVNGGKQQNVSCPMKKYLRDENYCVSVLGAGPTRSRDPLATARGTDTIADEMNLLLFGGEVIGQVKFQRAFLDLRADIFDLSFDCATAGLNGQRKRKL